MPTGNKKRFLMDFFDHIAIVILSEPNFPVSSQGSHLGYKYPHFFEQGVGADYPHRDELQK